MVVLRLLSKLFDYRHKFSINEEVKGYKIVEKLGEGRFGIAYLAINEENNKVIIKQLKREMLLRQPEKSQFEADILKTLLPIKTTRFPKYIDSFSFKFRRGYILEYKEGKTLEHLIYQENYVFSRHEIYNLTLQLLDMLQILEKNNIVHKDIRVSNVILNSQGNLSLIDFGLARYIDNKHYTKDLDYWYLADFLVHLYYTSYEEKVLFDKPWYEQLNLLDDELMLLKRLMKLDQEHFKPFSSINEIRTIIIQLSILISKS